MNREQLKKVLQHKIKDKKSKLDLLYANNANLEQGAENDYIIKSIYIKPIVDNENKDIAKIININKSTEDFKFVEELQYQKIPTTSKTAYLDLAINTDSFLSKYTSVIRNPFESNTGLLNMRLTAPYSFVNNPNNYGRSTTRQLEFVTRDMLEIVNKLLLEERLTHTLSGFKTAKLNNNRVKPQARAKIYTKMIQDLDDLDIANPLYNSLQDGLDIENLKHKNQSNFAKILFKKTNNTYEVNGINLFLFKDLTKLLHDRDNDIVSYDFETPSKYLVHYLFEFSYKYKTKPEKIIEIYNLIMELQNIIPNFESEILRQIELKNKTKESIDAFSNIFNNQEDIQNERNLQYTENFSKYFKENIPELYKKYTCKIDIRTMELIILFDEGVVI